jgi:prepilin-type N-terminal cleavage/methylation domain-containing protein
MSPVAVVPMRAVATARTTRSGMTLIELLVAIVITGMTLAAGYGALTTIIDRREQAQTAMLDLTHAVTVRNTLIDWLSHATLQLPTGGVQAPGAMSSMSLSMNGDDEELRFITTAQTPLRRDSTIVVLATSASGSTALYGWSGVGLAASLVPSLSAQQELSTASNTGTFGSGLGSSGFGSGTFGTDSSWAIPIFVSLDPAVVGFRTEYLISVSGQQQWITQQQLFQSVGRGTTLLAMRLTLRSDRPDALAPALRLPIVVPMQRAL